MLQQLLAHLIKGQRLHLETIAGQLLAEITHHRAPSLFCLGNPVIGQYPDPEHSLYGLVTHFGIGRRFIQLRRSEAHPAPNNSIKINILAIPTPLSSMKIS